MEHARLVSPDSFCWNQDCPDYGKVDYGNIVKFGRTKKGTQLTTLVAPETINTK